MKKAFFSLLFIMTPIVMSAQLRVYRNGNVTIGQQPQSEISKLAIGGTITTDGIVVPVKDITKESSKSLSSEDRTKTLSSIMAVDVLTYRLPSEINDEDKANQSSNFHYVVSPDELQLLFPSLVSQNFDGTKGINYTELVALLLSSIQELKQEVDGLRATLASLEESNYFQGSRSTDSNANSRYMAILMQNTPNPVRTQTVINYTLAGNYSCAFIRISDITGNIIKTFDIKSGTGSVSVNASDLGGGLFLYSLIVDDNIADTKKMVVTQ